MSKKKEKLKFIDLFCGIGGFRLAGERLGMECVFSSDIDVPCQISYAANFGETPNGDITKVNAEYIPNHDILFAGFPCQPFSIIGSRKGFSDTRGTLFFDIARILKVKKPKAFVLENVKQLAGHNQGKTIKRILEVLNELGYDVDYKILNALDFGLPQKRERVLIVGIRKEGSQLSFDWNFPKNRKISLEEVLEKEVPEKYYASDYIVRKRKMAHKAKVSPAIWHENKSGNITSYPYSCALRAGGSYNYLLVDGVRRMTPRELLRLQGYPDDYKIVVNYSQARKQAGNSVPVPMVQAVIAKLLEHMKEGSKKSGGNKVKAR